MLTTRRVHRPGKRAQGGPRGREPGITVCMCEHTCEYRWGGVRGRQHAEGERYVCQGILWIALLSAGPARQQTGRQSAGGGKMCAFLATRKGRKMLLGPCRSSHGLKVLGAGWIVGRGGEVPWVAEASRVRAEGRERGRALQLPKA